MPSEAAIARDARRQFTAAAASAAPEALRARCRVHELLVTEGYLGGRPRLQALFLELFPPPEANVDLRGWPDDPGPRFAELEHAAVARRRRAAAYFESRGRAELGLPSQLLLRDPRTVARLLRAAADPDAQVQAHAIRALGHIVGRFGYRSAEVLEALLALHHDAAPAPVRQEIAMAISTFDDVRIWPPLVDALGGRRLSELARRRLAQHAGIRPERMPPDVRRQVSAHLVALLRAERKLEVKTYLVRTIGAVGDRAAADELRAMPLRGVRPAARDAALAAIAARGTAARRR